MMGGHQLLLLAWGLTGVIILTSQSAAQSANRKPENLTLGALLPVGGVAGSGLAGEGLLASAKVAMAEINARSDILPRHHLDMDVKNTAPKTPGPPGMTMPERLRLAATAVAEWAQSQPPIPMIYGSVLTPVVESAAVMTGSFNMIQVASVANSPTLMNRKLYPYFVSTASSPASLNMVVIQFLKMNGWSRVGILTENVRPMPDVSNAFMMMAGTMGIKIVTSVTVQSGDNPRAALQTFQREDARVIISHLQHLMHLKVFCESYKMKMHAPNYVWINNYLVWDDLEIHYDTQIGQNKDIGNCTYDQLTTAAQGQFGTTIYEPYRRNDSQITIGGKTAGQIWKGMVDELKKKNMSSRGLGSWALTGYDALWAMALTLNNSLPADGSVTLADFSYTNPTVSNLLVNGFKDVSFTGAGGELKFDAKGSRSTLLTLDQISAGKASIIALYDSSKTPKFTYIKNVSQVWEPYAGKPPLDRSANQTLRLGVLLPMSLSGGKGVWAAAQVAVEEVNKQEQLLPGYRLYLDLKDTSVKATNNTEANEVQTGIMKISEFLNNDKPVLMIYGGLKSSVTAATASVSSAWNVVQVSPTATDPSLSDKNLYPYFLRTSLGGSSLNKLVAGVLERYKWDRVAIISENASPYNLMANDLQRILKSKKVEVVTSALLESHADPDKELASLKKLKVRIIIGQYFHAMHLKVLCAAYKNNMTAPGYVWIANDLLWDDLSSRYENEIRANPSLVSCSYEQVKRAAEGQFGTRAYEPKNNDDKVVYGGRKIRDVWNAILAKMDKSAAAGIGSYVLGAYDAILSMAQALHSSIPKISPKKLEDFTYRDPSLSDVFVKEFENLTFEGASGPVKFTSSGDRIGTLSLRQVQGGSSKQVATYDLENDKLKFIMEEDKIWSAYGKRTPKDQDDYKEIRRRIPPVLFIVCAVLAGFGILICLIYILSTFLVRTNSLLAGNWPVLSFMIAAGCLILDVAVIIFGIDESRVDEASLTPLCQAGTWILLIGMTIAYMSVIMKMFGIYNYFTSQQKGKKPKKEVTLVIIVFACVVIDFVILFPWQIIDPLTVKERSLSQQVDEDNQIIYTHQMMECTSYNLTYWRIACVVYKGCMLLAGAVFMWPALIASHRRGPGATDSNYLSISVFVTVLLSVVGLPLVYTAQDNPAVQYGIAASFILACSLITSVLLLGARILLLRQGDNVPSRILAPFDSWLETITDDSNDKNTRGAQEMNAAAVPTNGETNVI